MAVPAAPAAWSSAAARIGVRNTGIPISADKLAAVFDLLVQVHTG